MNITTKTLFIELVGQLHNIPELRSQLGLGRGLESGIEEIITAGWRRWGTSLAEHLVGDYALALLDKTTRQTYLVRNPLGVKPLYYRMGKGKIYHAFTINELNRRCPLPLTKDMDWAAAFMLQLSFSQTETAYKEIKKVPPGHWLTYDAEERITLQRYHEWRDDAPFTTKRDEKWVEAYREVLEEAIRCRMDLDAPMGTENSGGLDSATITAYLAHFLGEPGDRLHSFGFALCEQEPEFILKTSQDLHIRHNYIMTDRYGFANQPDHISHSLSILGYPEEHSNATAHIPFYLECQRRGIKTLFSGFGGDEVVTNSGGHLRWELLDRHQYAALWNILPGNPIYRTLRTLKAASLGRRNPNCNRRFFNAWNRRWLHQLLLPEVTHRLNLYERHMETAIFDAPYRRTNDFILKHYLTQMNVTARLENCALAAAAYGVDYRWPLWDERLVQQYLSTPSIEKVGPKGIGRYLHRKAIDEVVPKTVAWKQSKSMGYARLLQERNQTGVIEIAKHARRLDANMHPELANLIDQDKLREQITYAEQGGVNDAFAANFQRSITALNWLQNWLQNDHFPAH